MMIGYLDPWAFCKSGRIHTDSITAPESAELRMLSALVSIHPSEVCTFWESIGVDQRWWWIN